MENYLRQWFHSALEKNQFDSAIFIGDKLLALSDTDDTRLHIASAHFHAGNYSRALSFVAHSDVQRSAASRYLAAHCYIKQNKHEDALAILGEKNPLHLFTSADPARRKLQHISNGGLTSRQHGKSRMPSRTDRVDRSEERDQEEASNIKYEAGMCFLRGLCFAKQNAFDRAKECYKDAVRIDVQCFEAFDQLVKNSLMAPKEEWAFLDALNYDSILPAAGAQPGDQAEAADFTRNLYTTRLSKYANPERFDDAVQALSTHYKLGDNPDILLCEAERAFTASRFEPALALTTRILDADPYNFAALPLHLSLLSQLNHTHALFQLAHVLADTHPSEPCTWLAVGTYYLSTARIPEARAYFSKASLMDPHFGAAWIGFAHTFAAEGEADQAIAAYSTAARLFQGTHLPQLFLGMQEIALNNLVLAREYLTAAYALCADDPLLLSELGVVAYLEGQYPEAERAFRRALALADEHATPAARSAATRLNLAHTLRRCLRFEEALAEYDAVIRAGVREAGVFTAKGLVFLELDAPFEAVVALHEALALAPQETVASELLARALGELEGRGEVLGGVEEEAFDRGVGERVRGLRAEGGRRGRRREVREGDGEERAELP